MDDISFAPAPETASTISVGRAGRRDQQIARILDAAQACFLKYGFQGASMQQVCAEAGMSPGALYRYFPSKESIVEAICEKDREQDARLFEVVFAEPNAVDGVVLAAMAHIRHMHDEGLAPLFAEICAEAMRNGNVEATCQKNAGHVMDMFREYLSRAIARGEIDPVVELDMLLPALMAVAHGIAMHDMPSQGVPFEKIEILLRGAATGMLRPTHAAPSTAR